VNPALKMSRIESIALHLFPSGLGVAGVQVQPGGAGNHRERLVQIKAELVGIAGLARIVPGDRKAAAECFATVLKTADVITLPTVQRDRNRTQLRKGGIDVHAQSRVTLLCQSERLFYMLERSGHD